MRYILTSQRFTGQVELKYNAEGYLIYFKNDAEMKPEQYEWFKSHMPLIKDRLEMFQRAIQGNLQEVPEDLTFETTYTLYGYPRNRFRAEPLWKKMKDGERMDCIRSFKSYHRYVDRKGIAIMCFDRYLRERQWETDWNLLK